MKKKQTNKRVTHSRYWATGSSTVRVKAPIHSPFYLEHNTNINMYRLNSDDKRGVPVQLMGYTPHYKALIQLVRAYIRKEKRDASVKT